MKQLLYSQLLFIENQVNGNGFDVTYELLGSSALTAFVTVLVVGAILIALAPEYVRARMEEIVNDPVDNFIYGFIALVVLILVVILLILTILGILLAIPLLIIAYIVWAVGSAIAFLAIGDRLVGSGEDWLKPLLVGALINGGLALTGVGWIIGFFIGAAGFGTVLQDYFR